ncbi:pyridoxal phosphate-dependent class II aminotransferase [Methanocalculus taiwanensis]|uniref:Pyridoxal phosphate-dependent class II aminotransferase n=1 Tax=Methanocalculus taiwanensis TaxID=106207 RepID=A0ABD4TNT1_9EURY|nr:aminotransferase class I/II-fold pyridoxal phosphate-dependent enzyme [Methanocalculus taiwanensis]MCQ1538935.1 pyridoxal phosphate-dependent class II aminotransferase [Methanocalculus taiwanensis]
MKIKRMPKRQMHGGIIRKLRKQKSRNGILDFSASMNPFPPHVEWRPEDCDLGDYPDDTYSDLKEAIGSVYSRDPDEITVGNGSVELIRIFAQVMAPPGTTAFIERSTFGEYAQSVRLAGGSVTDNPHERVNIRYLCNPNNPTGTLLTKHVIVNLLDTCREEGSSLFLDEAFIDLSDPKESLVNHRDPDLFILRSLTKAFSVPGIRFGFGFGDPELIEAIELTRPPWTVNRYAEIYTIEAIRHIPDLEESRRKIAIERDFLTKSIRSIGLAPHSSSANYILIDAGMNSSDLTSALLNEGILVRDCRSFGLPESIRVAVRSHEENRILIEALSICAP